MDNVWMQCCMNDLYIGILTIFLENTEIFILIEWISVYPDCVWKKSRVTPTVLHDSLSW